MAGLCAACAAASFQTKKSTWLPLSEQVAIEVTPVVFAGTAWSVAARQAFTERAIDTASSPNPKLGVGTGVVPQPASSRARTAVVRATGRVFIVVRAYPAPLGRMPD
jgi:hypothetical protein